MPSKSSKPRRLDLQALALAALLALAGCQLDGVGVGAFGAGVQQGYTYGPPSYYAPYQPVQYAAPPVVICRPLPPRGVICF